MFRRGAAPWLSRAGKKRLGLVQSLERFGVLALAAQALGQLQMQLRPSGADRRFQSKPAAAALRLPRGAWRPPAPRPAPAWREHGRRASAGCCGNCFSASSSRPLRWSSAPNSNSASVKSGLVLHRGAQGGFGFAQLTQPGLRQPLVESIERVARHDLRRLGELRRFAQPALMHPHGSGRVERVGIGGRARREKGASAMSAMARCACRSAEPKRPSSGPAARPANGAALLMFTPYSRSPCALPRHPFNPDRFIIIFLYDIRR